MVKFSKLTGQIKFSFSILAGKLENFTTLLARADWPRLAVASYGAVISRLARRRRAKVVAAKEAGFKRGRSRESAPRRPPLHGTPTEIVGDPRLVRKAQESAGQLQWGAALQCTSLHGSDGGALKGPTAAKLK